jgi:hypothetical protein
MRNLRNLTRSATIAAFVLASGLGVLATPAMADGFTSFSIGTTFGGGHGGHHGYRGGYGHGYYGHGGRGYGWGPNVSLGFSSTYYGNPYSNSYYDRPYDYGYPSAYGYAPPVVVRQPIYTAPPADAYYDNANYYQSAYTAPPPANSCVQTREYQTTINIGGRNVPAYGTACLQPDGSWSEGPAQPEQ